MKNRLDLLNEYFDRLWPICRSITGNGLRDSFKILQELIPLKLIEVPTGQRVFDWEIPEEWNINDAYIIDPNGNKICDFKVNNLHVVNYSVPVNKQISFNELFENLHFIEQLPDAIPYVTSYYKRNWGFCISYNEFKSLPRNGIYQVFIDSSFKSGCLTYGELVLPGTLDREILFSTYLCHPSMANNELSGPLVMALLYKEISSIKNRKYTYRFLIAPETIGVIAFLAKNGKHLIDKLEAGYVLTCCGDSGELNYKRSKRNNSYADKVAEHVLKYSQKKHTIKDFSVGGSDERQYCSSGFNLPVGSIMRTPYKEFYQYHNSLDNKDFISFPSMIETVDIIFDMVKTIELNTYCVNQNPCCEPQLGKRDLYSDFGGQRSVSSISSLKMLHLLAYADGSIDLISIADKYNSSLLSFEKEILKLYDQGLIK